MTNRKTPTPKAPRPTTPKPLPHSPELERAYLGACLLSPPVFGRVPLTSEDFYVENHRETWLAIDVLHEEGEPLDLHTLREQLERRGVFDRIGGMAFLAGLDLDLPALGNIENYAKRLREYRRRRHRIAAGERFVGALYEGGPEELSERTRELRRLLEERDVDEDDVPLAVDVDSFLALRFPPREWLVEGLLQRKDAGMIHAWRGVGKTHFVLSLTWALVSAGAFLRFKIPQAAGVLVVDGEMPREDLQARLARIVGGSGAQRIAPLRILAADMFDSGLPSLATIRGQAIVEANLERFPDIKVVVVDNISTLCMSGQAENEAESWNAVQEFVLRLRRRGVSVVFVHHSNKNLSQRGTSKREDILSWVLDLRRPDDYREEDGARFEMRFSKARAIHGEAAQPLDVKLIDADGGGLDWSWKPVAEPQSKSRRGDGLALLAEGKTVEEVAEAMGVHRATIFRWKASIPKGEA